MVFTGKVVRISNDYNKYCDFPDEKYWRGRLVRVIELAVDHRDSEQRLWKVTNGSKSDYTYVFEHEIDPIYDMHVVELETQEK